jgi:hypothetical protein
MLAALGIIFQIPFIWLFVAILLLTIDYWPSLEYDERWDYALLTIGTAVIAFLVSLMFSWFIKQDCFQYTHYPIRFNRKTRKVYFFRRDGTTWSAPWDKLYFTIFHQSFNRRRVNMLLLDREWTDEPTFYQSETGQLCYKDPETLARIERMYIEMQEAVVLEQVPLPYITTADDTSRLYSIFDFIRCYMDGDDALVGELAKQIDYVPDIVGKRQGFFDGWYYMDMTFTGNYLHARIGYYLTTLLFYIVGRWVAMHTCKIPVWPKEVEQECQFEPNDPNLRDAQHLSPPDAAQVPWC